MCTEARQADQLPLTAVIDKRTYRRVNDIFKFLKTRTSRVSLVPHNAVFVHVHCLYTNKWQLLEAIKTNDIAINRDFRGQNRTELDRTVQGMTEQNRTK